MSQHSSSGRNWIAGGELGVQEGATEGPGAHKRALCDLLEKGETVTRALKRLRPAPIKAGSKLKAVASSRHGSSRKGSWKHDFDEGVANKGAPDAASAVELKVQFNMVTDAAAELMNMGFEDIYVVTKEQILDTVDDGFNTVRGKSKYVWHDDGDEEPAARGAHRAWHGDDAWRYGSGHPEAEGSPEARGTGAALGGGASRFPGRSGRSESSGAGQASTEPPCGRKPHGDAAAAEGRGGGGRAAADREGGEGQEGRRTGAAQGGASQEPWPNEAAPGSYPQETLPERTATNPPASDGPVAPIKEQQHLAGDWGGAAAVATTDYVAHQQPQHQYSGYYQHPHEQHSHQSQQQQQQRHQEQLAAYYAYYYGHQQQQYQPHGQYQHPHQQHHQPPPYYAPSCYPPQQHQAPYQHPYPGQQHYQQQPPPPHGYGAPQQ